MEKPTVSVVIPAYNCAATIEAAIGSAINQDVPVEIIVVSDCSPDDLDSVMAKFAAVPQVTYLRNAQNLGAAMSRNNGIAAAKGEFIAFLDADDHWVEGKLKKQLTAMRESGAVLCCTARELLTPDGIPTGRVIPVKSRIAYKELLKHNSINCSSVLIKTEVAREFPMHDDDSHEDYIMWLEVLKKYGFACGINEPLLKYRLSNTGKSGSKLQSAKMTYQVYRRTGFGVLGASLLFCRYAIHGVLKYTLSRRTK